MYQLAIFMSFVLCVYVCIIAENATDITTITHKKYAKRLCQITYAVFAIECLCTIGFHSHYSIMMFILLLSRVFNVVLTITSFKDTILFLFMITPIVGQYLITQSLYNFPVIINNYHYIVST